MLKPLNGIALIAPFSKSQCLSAVGETLLCLDMEITISEFRLSLQCSVVPDRYSLIALLMVLPELNKKVAELPVCQQRFADTGHQYELAWVEMDSLNELALFYAGVTVNAQWGVEFEYSEANGWEFGGYC